MKFYYKYQHQHQHQYRYVTIIIFAVTVICYRHVGLITTFTIIRSKATTRSRTIQPKWFISIPTTCTTRTTTSTLCSSSQSVSATTGSMTDLQLQQQQQPQEQEQEDLLGDKTTGQPYSDTAFPMTKYNSKSEIRSLCGPYVLLHTLSTTNNTLSSGDDSNIDSGDTNDTNDSVFVFRMQYMLLPINDLKGQHYKNYSNISISSSSSISISAEQIAWTLLQQQQDDSNEYVIQPQTLQDATTTTTITGETLKMITIFVSYTPSLHELHVNMDDNRNIITDDNNNHDSECFMAVMARILLQHTLTRYYTSTMYTANQQQQQLELSSVTTTITLHLFNEVPFQCTIPISLLTVNSSTYTNNNDDEEYISFVRSLFHYHNTTSLLVNTTKSELVEMVYVGDTTTPITHWNNHNNNNNARTQQHNVLGVVPRYYIHQYNLLHRGVGVLITKDRPIIQASTANAINTTNKGTTSVDDITRSSMSIQYQQSHQPDIYCHQRTATKRIFPSLYDMFIGGVSNVNEESSDTALREVSEELGIRTDRQQLSHRRLYQCIVCTSYNRCVVDVYGYTLVTTPFSPTGTSGNDNDDNSNSYNNQIQWQEEEVAWGAFIPFHIVVTAVHHSIARLQHQNNWHGRYDHVVTRINNYTKFTELGTTGDEKDVNWLCNTNIPWKSWDFVPDGLLVWESFLQEVLF